MRTAVAVVPVALSLLGACEPNENLISHRHSAIEDEFQIDQRQCNSPAFYFARGDLLTFVLVYNSCMEAKDGLLKTGNETKPSDSSIEAISAAQ
jgi:hypothetical protein